MATRQSKWQPGNPRVNRTTQEASRQSKGNLASGREMHPEGSMLHGGNQRPRGKPALPGENQRSTVETSAHGRPLPFPNLQSGRTCVIGTVMRSIEAFDLNGRRREFTILSDEELL